MLLTPLKIFKYFLSQILKKRQFGFKCFACFIGFIININSNRIASKSLLKILQLRLTFPGGLYKLFWPEFSNNNHNEKYFSNETHGLKCRLIFAIKTRKTHYKGFFAKLRNSTVKDNCHIFAFA